MSERSDSYRAQRHEQWVLVVRRSFGIPDIAGAEEARSALVIVMEEQLHENGWQSAPHSVANPMAEALLALGAADDFDDRSLPVELNVWLETITIRDAAHRLIDRGLTTIDPEHLAYDVSSEFPPEIVAAAEAVLERVFEYVREKPLYD